MSVKSLPKKGGLMPVPLIDLQAQVKPLRQAILKDWAEALDKGAYVNGPHGKALEAELAGFLGCAEVVGCNSGTDALFLILRALDIGPGDEVLVPAFSFFATAEAVSIVGAKPVFCDIEPSTFLLSLDEVAKKLTGRTKAVLPVHLFGLPMDLRALAELLQKKKSKAAILEDSAQAVGATVRGKRAGALGLAAGISFYPTKNLSAAGDAGAVATHDKALAARVRRLREHGMPQRYHHDEIGYNSRLDELQAIVVRHKLRHLDRWNAARRGLAARYHEALQGLPVGLPLQHPGAVWHQYTLRVPGGKREALRLHLADKGVASAVFYPIPMHLQKPYRKGAPKLPQSERAANEVLSLPIFPELTAAQQGRVVGAIRDFYAA
jgi:dTDP-4-amino-4,6-dideoxygalactose transaminase